MRQFAIVAAIIPAGAGHPLSRLNLPDHGRPYVLLEAEAGERSADIDRGEILGLYQAHGALLLRGFAKSLEEFGAFASSFCPVAVHNDSGNRAVLGGSGTVQSVNLGTRPFPLHPELSREPWKPDSCFFYCIDPPPEGGATTICDGVAIVRSLPSAIREGMEGRRLKYVMKAGRAQLDYWLGSPSPDAQTLANPPLSCPYFFERIQGEIARCFTRPLLHRPMFTEAPAFGNFLLFARYLRGVRTFPLLDDGSIVPDEWVEAVRLCAEPLTVPIAWQEHDLLMLDNSRFMHGRTEVTHPGQRLIATYFGYLDGAIPDPEEPSDPVWRKPGFTPPPAGDL